MAEKKENAKLILEKSKQVGEKIKSFLSEKLEYVIAFIVCVVISAVSLSSGFKSLEFKYYDTYLKLKAEIPQSKDIIMAFVDDDAIGEIGTYPWSRDIYADMLIRLREVGAKAAVFDIEFLDKSSMGVNPDYVANKLPKEYSIEASDNSVSVTHLQ